VPASQPCLISSRGEVAEAGFDAVEGTTGEREIGEGETAPGRWSGDRLPDVISPRGVTVVGTERRRSLYDTKEIRRFSLDGVM